MALVEFVDTAFNKCFFATLAVFLPTNSSGLDYIDNDLVSNVDEKRLKRGDRVKIRSSFRESRDVQGRFGRVLQIHGIDEIHIKLDEIEQTGATVEIPSSVFICSFDELEIIKPLFSGYLYKFAVSGFIRNWKRRFFEVWEKDLTYKENEFTFEYKDLIPFSNNTTLIAPTSNTMYPFTFPTDVPSETGKPHISIFKYNLLYLYCAGDNEQEVSAFSDAIARGVDENA